MVNWELWRRHGKQLSEGSLPVFIAAAINQAVAQLIDAAAGTSHVTIIISLNMVYSLFSHIFGIWIIVSLSQSNYLYRYWTRICTENASFSWKQTFTLVVLKWLYSPSGAGMAFFAWFITFILVLVLIYVSCFVRHLFFFGSNVVHKSLVEFDTDVFSLAIAFSFTIIIASIVYSNASSNYLSGVDDVHPLTDDGIDRSFSFLFVIYAIVLTILLTLLQGCHVNSLFFSWKSLRTTSANRISQEKPLNDNQPLQISFNSTSAVESKSLSWADYIEEGLFGWDPQRRSVEVFRYVLPTILAYAVACAWYCWAMLSFQNFFNRLHGGTVFGLFLFAVFVTLLMMTLMTNFSPDPLQVNANNLFSQATSKASPLGLTETANLPWLLITGRLIVGWAWEFFLVSAILLLIPNQSTGQLWLDFLGKLVAALLFLALGTSWKLFLKNKDHDHDHGDGDMEEENDPENKKESISRKGRKSDSTLHAPLL